MGALVLGFDDTDGARAALAAAIEIAKAINDRVVVTFGYEPPVRGEGQGPTRAAAREVGERVTKPAVEALETAGVEHELSLRAERPVDALLSAAEEHDARAIVVGTWGESPLKGAILGSTPYKLLHVSKRPVLAVPA
jgi:nucleotide-binding universal stress UspA family protein